METSMFQLAMRLLMWMCGTWLLFKIPDFKDFLMEDHEADASDVSIIIPARNEEKRLPHLLHSLSGQSIQPLEVIVADDDSDDRTAELAREAGCTVMDIDPLPPGWLGKAWASWQGAGQAKGQILLFLDADTVLEENGLEKILKEYHKGKSPLSIQPFHTMKKTYENLSAFFNIVLMMGTNVFSPLGTKSKALAFFGPCQVISRHDYMTIGGHHEVKDKILEDIAMGRAFTDRNIPVRCMAGRGAVSFRMYPGGIMEVIEGWSKNFASGAQSVGIINLILICLWISGAAGTTVLFAKNAAIFPAGFALYVLFLYLLYGLQIYWMLYRIGNFSPFIILLYPAALLFFILVFIRALIMTFIFKKVTWKGRVISTESRKGT